MVARESWRSRLRHPAFRLGLMLFITYGYFIAPPSWNPNARFDLTRSLVERGRIDIDPYHFNTADKAFHDGHHYSDKAPGISFLAAPIYAAYLGIGRIFGIAPPAAVVLGRDGVADPGRARGDGDDDVILSPSYRAALYLCGLFTSGLSGAVLGGLLLAWFLRRGFGAVESWLGAAALGLGSLGFPYATMFYGHVPAALFGFTSFVLVSPAPTLSRAFLSGLAAGVAVTIEFPTAIVAAVVAGTLVLDIRRGPTRFSTLPAWLAGIAIPVALLALYNNAAFGHPLRPGYAALARGEFAAAMGQGFFGLTWPQPRALFLSLFGRERGLIYVAPVLALAIIGLLKACRSRSGSPEPNAARAHPIDTRTWARPAGIVAAVFLLFSSSYYMWWGGDALGPRHVIPALPFLCLGVPAFVSGTATRRLTLGLLLLSAFNLMLATAVGAEVPFGLPHGDVLYDHVYHHVAHGRVAAIAGTSNLGLLVGLHGPLSIMPLLFLWMIPLAGIGLQKSPHDDAQP